MRKGQVEIVAILGIVVIAVVIAYFALSGVGTAPTAPSGVQQEQLQVKNSIENFIRGGAEETLSAVSLYGGYLSADEFPLGYTELNGRETPYWFSNGNIQTPNMDAAIRDGITSYIRDNKASLQESLAGSDVVLGDPSVSTRILSNQLVVDVTMPVTVKGYPVTGPFSVSVPTAIGEISEFASNFITFISTDRFFEDVTLYQILGSPMNDGVQELPLLVSPVECGKHVYLDWYTLKPRMEEGVRSALAHTYLPGQYPTNVGDKTSFMKFSLPEINGKEYSNLQVSFHTPDGFELTSETFQFAPDPISTEAKPIPMTSACAAEPVYVNYYVFYPAVAQVKDPFTGNLFRFAFQVFLLDNQPGEWGSAGYTTTAQAQICQNPECIADVEVIDSEGNPVPYASIRFAGCGYRTDASGVFEGNIPCAISDLTVIGEGYGMHTTSVASDYLEDARITLYRRPLVNMHFHEVSVQNDSFGNTYIIDSDGIRWVRNDIRPEEAVSVVMLNTDTGERFDRFFDTTSGSIQLPIGDYIISAAVSSQDLMSTYGGFSDSVVVTEDTKSLHLYIPYMEGFSEIQNNETMIAAGSILTSVLQNCSVGPVSESPVSLENSCYVGYDEV